MGFGDQIMNSAAAAEPWADGITKGAAVAIILPAFTFKGGANAMSRTIYMNMCNPATIMKVGGAWIAYGDKMRDAGRKLGEKRDAVTADVWEGDDAEAFKADALKSENQLDGIANQAYQIGMFLLLIGAYMSAFWVMISYYAYGLLGMAAYYQVARFIPYLKPTAEAVRVFATGFAAFGHINTEMAAKAASKPTMACAALMGVLTGASWIRQANNDNMDDLGSIGEFLGDSTIKTLFGSLSLLERNLTAPGGAGGMNAGNWYGFKPGTPNPFGSTPGLGTIWGGASQVVPSGGVDENGDWSVGYDDGPGVTGLGVTDHAAEAWAEHGPGWGQNPDAPDWSNDGSFGR